MALNISGVQVNVPSTKLPTTTYTAPVVTTFTDYEYVLFKNVSISKATVDETDPTTTFTALLTAIQADINTQITAELDVTRTVEAYIELRDVDFNTDFDRSPYTDATTNYVCETRTYIKSS